MISMLSPVETVADLEAVLCTGLLETLHPS